MSVTTPSTDITDINQLLDELESIAPTTQEKVAYRTVNDNDVINDELDEFNIDDSLLEEEPETRGPIGTETYGYKTCKIGPVVAIDCGIVRLGETENGLIIALRATIVVDDGKGHSKIKSFKTGPIYLRNDKKADTLLKVGQSLGQEDFFVKVEKNAEGKTIPRKVKDGVADNANQLGDRFRNWMERLIQRISVGLIKDGIILIDGALTLNSRDTPSKYLKKLAEMANSNGNALVGISKKSKLLISGRPIQFCLDDKQNQTCYRSITGFLTKDSQERILGNAYVARFSKLGPTFRVDIKAKEGQSDREVMDLLFSSALMRGGYPDILVRAHTHSYFTSPDVYQLQALIGAKYALLPKPEVNLTGIFAPFGGRFK